jgi:hypothetical protein
MSLKLALFVAILLVGFGLTAEAHDVCSNLTNSVSVICQFLRPLAVAYRDHSTGRANELCAFQDMGRVGRPGPA